MRTYEQLKLELSEEEYKMFDDLAKYIEKIPEEEYDRLDRGVQNILDTILNGCYDLLELTSGED